MPSCQLIEKLPFKWELYRKSAASGQIASGILVLISAVALAILMVTQPLNFYLGVNLYAMITLGAVGGASFITFAICSCLNHFGLVKIRQNIANKQYLRESKTSTAAQAEAPIVVTTTLEQDPVEFVKQVLIQPLLREFKRATLGAVKADCILNKTKLPGKSEEVDWVFTEGEKLFEYFISNPQIYVDELLCCFGPGKIKPSALLRRLITAYNSENTEKYAEIKSEYAAVLRGNDFVEIVDALNTQSAATLMQTLPSILERHFCLPDEVLKNVGQQVLSTIFEKTQSNTKVLDALNALKKQANSPEKLAKNMQQFLVTALTEAQVSADQFKSWNDVLIKHTLNVTFKKNVGTFLGLVARNIRLLRLLLDEKTPVNNRYIKLDETFLFSESLDCIKKTELQKELLLLQSNLNINRGIDEKVALIALPEQDARSFEAICQQEDIVKLCFEANKQKRSNLTQNEIQQITNLGNRHHVRLIAVPITISDHPFKQMIQYKNNPVISGVISSGAVAPFLRWLPTFLKPGLKKFLPKMDAKTQARFDKFFERLLNLLVYPVYNGAIGDTDFRPTFERIIITQGEALALKIDSLLQEGELTFEKIRDVWTSAVTDIAQEFEKVEIKS